MSILMDALKVKAQSHSEPATTDKIAAGATGSIAEQAVLPATADGAAHKPYRTGDAANGSTTPLRAKIQPWPLHPPYVGAVLLLSSLVVGGIWAGYWLGQQGGVRHVAATLLSTSAAGGVDEATQSQRVNQPDAVKPQANTRPSPSDASSDNTVLPSTHTTTTDASDAATLVATPGLILAELSAVPSEQMSAGSLNDAENSYLQNSYLQNGDVEPSYADHNAINHNDSGYIGGLDDVAGTDQSASRMSSPHHSAEFSYDTAPSLAAADAIAAEPASGDVNAYVENEEGMQDNVAQAMPYTEPHSQQQHITAQHSPAQHSPAQHSPAQHSQNLRDTASIPSNQTLSAQDAAYLATQAELMRAEQLKAAFSAALAQQGLAAPQGLKTPTVGRDGVADSRQATASTSSTTSSTQTETVPVDLASSFQQALQAVPARSTAATAQSVSNSASASPVPDLRSLPKAERQQVPVLRVEAHIYASVESARYVKINGKTLQQGQWLTPELRLVEVGRDHVVLQRGTRQFSLPALTDWLGEPAG
jgi:general secretion pathway protein B